MIDLTKSRLSALEPYYTPRDSTAAKCGPLLGIAVQISNNLIFNTKPSPWLCS